MFLGLYKTAGEVGIWHG